MSNKENQPFAAKSILINPIDSDPFASSDGIRDLAIRFNLNPDTATMEQIIEASGDANRRRWAIELGLENPDTATMDEIIEAMGDANRRRLAIKSGLNPHTATMEQIIEAMNKSK